MKKKEKLKNIGKNENYAELEKIRKLKISNLKDKETFKFGKQLNK